MCGLVNNNYFIAYSVCKFVTLQIGCKMMTQESGTQKSKGKQKRHDNNKKKTANLVLNRKITKPKL